MPTTPSTSAAGEATAHTVDDQFLDLICADADLLAAEFDAIITAAWQEPPADRAGRGAAGGQPGSGAASRAAEQVRGPVCRPRHPGIGEWTRQRSPPPRSTEVSHAERQVIAPREPTDTR